jgi:hypothetical protein
VVACAVLVALLTSACGKGAARTALLAGDDAILGVKPDAEKYAPDAFASLVDRAAAARAAYDRGDYRSARDLASGLPARAAEVHQAAVAAMNEAEARWESLRDDLPDLLNLVSNKLAALATMRRPPTFIGPDETRAATRRLAEASEAWSAALRAFNDGDLIGAVARANAARATTDELAALLEPIVLPPTEIR